MIPVSVPLLTRYKWYARCAAGFVIVCSLLVLIGWATNNVSLQSLFPDMGRDRPLPFVGRIHASAAISFIMCSVALLLLMARNKALRVSGLAVAAVSLVGSLVGLYFTCTGDDIEPIRLFQPDPAAVGITYPVPSVMEVSITTSLLALALLVVRLPSLKNISFGQVAALAAAPIPLLIILSAATQIEQLCDIGGCFKMSTGFAILALILCSAIFFSRAESGFAALFAGDSTGSAILRRATLFICFIPALLIARSFSAYAFGLTEDQRLTWVFFVFFLIVLMIGFVVSGVSLFNKVETELSSRLDQTRDELERTRPSSSSADSHTHSNSWQSPLRFKKVCLTCTSEFPDTFDNCPVDSSPLNRVVDNSLEGSVFAEKYQILDELGSGGMSTVYRARHLFMNIDVAIKVLKANTASTSDGLKRFKREARANSSIKHSGVVGVSDFGLAPDGRAFLVMEYLHGESLSDYLDRANRLDLKLVAQLNAQICDALEAAHNQNVVHRDLKPSNIMLVKGANGQLETKIVDFGLAKIMDEDVSQKITQTGDCFGSPLYMSPEQCMGKKVDHRTDIYALGCILFECLTGYPPLMGANAAATIKKHVMERPAPFPDELGLPNEVKEIIYKALHKDPAWRPAHAHEIKDVLVAAAKSWKPPARSVKVAQQAHPWTPPKEANDDRIL